MSPMKGQEHLSPSIINPPEGGGWYHSPSSSRLLNMLRGITTWTSSPVNISSVTGHDQCSDTEIQEALFHKYDDGAAVWLTDWR